MKIGPDNYQEWALDYIEGNLSREERASFESFLTRHADIAREIASLQDDMPVMVAEQIVYPDKRSLLRGGKTMSFGRITSFLGGAAAASLLIGLFTLVDSHSSQKEQLLADGRKRFSAKSFRRTGRMDRFGKRGRQRRETRHPATGRRHTATSRVRQPHRPPDQRPDNVPDERPGRTARAHSAVVGTDRQRTATDRADERTDRPGGAQDRRGSLRNSGRKDAGRRGKERRTQKIQPDFAVRPVRSDHSDQNLPNRKRTRNRNCIHPTDRQQNTKNGSS